MPVSLATVYNTLNQFRDAGLLREVVVAPGRSYFDTNIGHHHHFFVETDGELHDFPSDEVTIAGLPAPPEGTHWHGSTSSCGCAASDALALASRLQFLEQF